MDWAHPRIIPVNPSTIPFYKNVSNGAASTISYTFDMVQPLDSNPQPPAPKADAIQTKLSRAVDRSPDKSV